MRRLLAQEELASVLQTPVARLYSVSFLHAPPRGISSGLRMEFYVNWDRPFWRRKACASHLTRHPPHKSQRQLRAPPF